MTIARRQFLQSAVASVAVAVPAMLPGFVMSPAAASILKAAPYVPASGDAELIRLAAQFHAVAAEQEDVVARLGAMPSLSAEDCAAADAEIDRLYVDWAGTSDACYEMAPTTPAGAVALLGVILARDADFIDDEPMKGLRVLHGAMLAMVRA